MKSKLVLAGIKRTLAQKSGLPYNAIDDTMALLFNRSSQKVGMSLKESKEIEKIINITLIKMGGKPVKFSQYNITKNRKELARGRKFSKMAEQISGKSAPVREHVDTLKASDKLYQMPNEEERRHIEARSLINTLLTELASIVASVEGYTTGNMDSPSPTHWNIQAVNTTLSYIEEQRARLLQQADSMTISESLLLQLHNISAYATIFWYDGNESGTGKIEDMALQDQSLDRWIYLGDDNSMNGAHEFIQDIDDILT